ncbi:hypothetical protein [Curtobacterium sp. SL109]|jgi:hypothetical protein|uniref:hypothetical protein n=2 Tax=unclassified Curtobacterium TaxID=257496 RepID=UPI0022750FF7|nr:hypothetical protein [Curtobacterium sp. SL109]MCY1694842.1 hypothetical protein [Curtobacterium sp. SL109]
MSNQATAAWVGVIITLVISIWSITVARRAERTARTERSVREAAKVSAWISTTWSVSAPEDDSQKSNILVIRNSSDAVIHDVEATALMNKREATFSAAVCPPGESFATWKPGGRFAWELLASCSELATGNRGSRAFTKSPNWRLVSLRFTDAFGARWEYRSGEGVTLVR